MSKRWKVWSLGFLLGALCVLLSSCASTIDISPATTNFRVGNMESSISFYERKKSDVIAAQGEIVYNLDLGMMYRRAGDFQKSNLLLSAADTEIEANYTKSITQGVGSYLVNDNTIEYAGEDYENVYLNVFKALNYYSLGSVEDSMVELRRSAEKQSLLQTNYDAEWNQVSGYATDGDYSVSVPHADFDFSTSALSNYLMMVMSRGMKDSNTFEVARKQVSRAFDSQASLFDFSFPAFVSEETYDLPAGQARLNFVVFSGMAPVKEQREDFVEMPGGYWGKLAYPALISRPSLVRSVRASISGSNYNLEVVENLDSIIRDTFYPKQQLAISKTILRSYLKNTATWVYDRIAKDKDTKQEVSIFFSVLSAFSQVTNVISEQADVRCSHFLPSKAWGGGITLEPGTYQVEIQFLGSAGNVVSSTIQTIEVRAGQSNLVIADCAL